MPQSEFQNLIAALRSILKTRKITYATIAKDLGVSEATIKRFFTGHDGSVGRIEEICESLSISFADLVEQARSRGETTYELTYDQEAFFAENLNYYAFFKELSFFRLTPQEIRSKHGLNANSLPRYLRRLEKLGLIEWLPGDRVKVKVQGTQNWITNGPLVKKLARAENRAFFTYLEEIFIKDPKSRDSHLFTSSTRYMHPDTLRALNSELKELFETIRARVYRDEIFYPKHELVPTKWVLGLAPYTPTPTKITDL
jgi:transcriptional regulator with XRE-family HTH domain